MNNLSEQLSENRQANSLPGDSFATDLEVVEEHLQAADAERRELGVRLAERLRLAAEGRERQLLVTRLLADFYRENASYPLAVEEFTTILRYLGPLPEEPELLYEFATVLQQAGDVHAAFRTVSMLLANQQMYIEAADNEEVKIQRQQLIRRSWLLRGHLQAALADNSFAPPAVSGEVG